MTPVTFIALIYLRLSDFRDGDDLTFTERGDEQRRLADKIGATVLGEPRIENDLTSGGRSKPASAYKTPKRVTTSTGLATFRTNRPVWERAVLDLQRGVANLLIVGDYSRISRNERDGLDLIDACKVSGAWVVCPDDDGEPLWILTKGGTRKEVDALRDEIAAARRFSADIGRKVAKGRKRWAGKSYGGGRPGYGFKVAEGTAEHARRLEIEEDEAKILRVSADQLLRGVSLKAITRDLRDNHVPTRSGTAWTTRSLRGALIKPSVAGLIGNGHGELVPGPWPPIFEDRDVWLRVVAKLTDPARRTNLGRGNAPKHLVSLFATCGVCHKPLRVGGAGRGRGPAYVGQDCGHVRRSAPDVDRVVADAVIKRLSQPGMRERLRPPARRGVDRAALGAELTRLHQRAERYRAQATAEDADDLFEVLRGIHRQEAAIHAQLAESADEPDDLEEFWSAPAEVAWAALSLARRRIVVQRVLASVEILPAGRGHGFDPAKVRMTPR